MLRHLVRRGIHVNLHVNRDVVVDAVKQRRHSEQQAVAQWGQLEAVFSHVRHVQHTRDDNL